MQVANNQSHQQFIRAIKKKTKQNSITKMNTKKMWNKTSRKIISNINTAHTMSTQCKSSFEYSSWNGRNKINLCFVRAHYKVFFSSLFPFAFAFRSFFFNFPRFFVRIEKRFHIVILINIGDYHVRDVLHACTICIYVCVCLRSACNSFLKFDACGFPSNMPRMFFIIHIDLILSRQYSWSLNMLKKISILNHENQLLLPVAIDVQCIYFV